MMVQDGEVVPAQPHAPMVDEGVIMDEAPMMTHEGGSSCSSCGGNCGGSCDSGCGSCGFSDECSTCCNPRGLCICLPAHGWAHAEFLLWWQSGMNVPVLATQGFNGPVLFGGNNNNLEDARAGGRIRFGTWLDRFPGLGIEGEYLGLGQETQNFSTASNGNPVISRPFFDLGAAPAAPAAKQVAGGLAGAGSLSIDLTSRLDGAAARFRRSLYSANGCGYSSITCSAVPSSTRVDSTLGYRYFQLKEALQVTELSTQGGRVIDRFETRNQFDGAELGVVWQGRRGLWSLDGSMRVGVGNSQQTATISGSTILPNLQAGTGGILAVNGGNIGTFQRQSFAMIPELGLTLGYQMTRNVRFTTGYNLIYWGNVLRPGDQIDLDINSTYWPFDVPVGTVRPQFQFVSSDYWVQGLSFGADIRW